jgi:UDP-N-acetylglucosamine 3-dehydrogenase
VGSKDQSGGQLRAAVIGLGAMGRHHVRVYGDLPQVNLVAVADVSESAVSRATAQRLIRGYTDIEEMLDREKPDLVSIVVPTSLHHQVALMAMQRGVHALVEKPIAGTLDQALDMIWTAEQNSVRLMIGHIERFNPAIVELKRRIEQVGDIFQISARRIGPFPDRIQDVGVVVDLASHDIDAMNYIIETPVESVYAQTAQRIHAAHEDMLLGTMRFAGGTIGSLDVNWLTPTKIRELTVIGSRGTFAANYLTQDLAFFENAASPSEWDDFSTLQQVSEGHAIRYAFRKEEPLRAELEAFVESVRHDTAPPAPPQGAADALAIALDLIESARTGQPIKPAFTTS